MASCTSLPVRLVLLCTALLTFSSVLLGETEVIDETNCPVSDEHIINELESSVNEYSDQLEACHNEGLGVKLGLGLQHESQVQTFAFGVVIGVFSTLSGIIWCICCCIFCDHSVR